MKSAKKSQFPCEISAFFVGQLGKPFFLHYNLQNTGSLGYQFSSIWTTPWPDEKDLFLKFNNLNLFEIIADFRMKN